MAAMLTGESGSKPVALWQLWVTIAFAVISSALVVGAGNNRLANVESRQDKTDVILSKVYDGINDLRERAARIEANQDKRQ